MNSIFKILFLIFILFSFGCRNEKSKAKNKVMEPFIEDKSNLEIEKDTTNIEFLMGQFVPSKHPDFVKIEKLYTDRTGLYMQRSAYDAYKLMYAEAKKNGISLIIKSATRNFDYQKKIWENKWLGLTMVGGEKLSQTISDPVQRAREILKYSSMPGSSRHHWGTDIDINSLNNNWFEQNEEGIKLYQWMKTNAYKYGYCQVYSDKSLTKRTGYEEEKWHWSYLPLSTIYTRDAGKIVKNTGFRNFRGASTAVEIDMVNNYILGIDNNCKETPN